ncbi:MAG: insulinase family protein [Candidatus Omnitrophica bacterium]|nr:insulinase family protein [Candidatus Omnitrophota bacterium]
MSVPGPEIPSSVSPARELERPPVVRRVLPNGLTLLVLEDHANPLVAFHAVVRTGSATEGKFYGSGISHVVEHMLFKGTARRPVGAVEQEARSYGGTTQGFTTYDTTSYQAVVNQEYWSQAADLLVDALFSPSMDPEEFRKEQQVVLRELKMRRDDPEQVAWDLLFENAYRVHPYRAPIIGHEPILSRLTRDDIVEYHRSHYLPNRVVIGVAGDVEAEGVIQRMEELTSRIQPGSVEIPVVPEEPQPVSPREVTEEVEAAHGIVTVGFPGVPLTDPDLYALDLLAWILGGGRGSRLDLALKETGIVHSVSCSNYTPSSKGLFVVQMRMDPERMEKALQELRARLDETRRSPFTPAEVEAARRALLLDYVADRQAVGAEASDLAAFETLVGDPHFAARYIEEVQRVDLKDLQRVAARYLDLERATTIRLLPRGTASILRPSSARPASKPAVEKRTLPSGLRLLLREDHRVPLVTFQLSMLGGVRYETERTNGISLLTTRMLLRGTGRRSAEEIIGLVRQMGGELSPVSGRNSVGLTLAVVSSELPRAADLLGELILEPAFPEEELEKERRLALAALKASEEDPFPWGMRRLAASLFTVHPYRLDPAGNPDSLASLKREDLARFYRRILDPKEMVVAVIGDFKRQELLDRLRPLLEKLPPPQGGSFPIAPEPPLGGQRERREVSGRKEGLILIGFPGIRVTDPRVPHLDLIETILSGGAGRLFTEVRERRGLAYTVGAFGVHGVDPGSFILYAVTEPAQLETVRQALIDEARRLGAAPVPPEEFHRAQQGLLGARRVARQTQAALASQASLDELYGLGFDSSDRYEAAVKEATPQQIQELARAVLDPQRCVVLLGQPKEESRAANEASGELAEAAGKK